MADNFYKECPAMMSDGRLFTDYRSSVRTNEHLKRINGIKRDDEYRLFLQNNAKKIMDNQWATMRKYKSCWSNQCVHNYPVRMHYPWFSEERKKADSLHDPNGKNIHVCPKLDDYRAN
jgi:hypothetical protein